MMDILVMIILLCFGGAVGYFGGWCHGYRQGTTETERRWAMLRDRLAILLTAIEQSANTESESAYRPLMWVAREVSALLRMVSPLFPGAALND